MQTQEGPKGDSGRTWGTDAASSKSYFRNMIRAVVEGFESTDLKKLDNAGIWMDQKMEDRFVDQLTEGKAVRFPTAAGLHYVEIDPRNKLQIRILLDGRQVRPDRTRELVEYLIDRNLFDRRAVRPARIYTEREKRRQFQPERD